MQSPLPGLTKREAIAALLMAGMYQVVEAQRLNESDQALCAIFAADALLAALEKGAGK
jgi:hypothetical protein